MSTTALDSGFPGAVFRYSVAVLVTLLALLLRWALHGVIGQTMPFVTFLPAIGLAALVGGAGPGLLATALSTLAALVWFVEPVGVLGLTVTGEAIGAGLFCLGGGLVSVAAEMMRGARQREHQARLRQVRAEADRERERVLREDALRFRTMIQAIPSLTFEGDADGRNTFSSDQWCAYTGMTEEQTLGWGWAQAVHPEDVLAARERWEEAVRAGQPLDNRLRIRSREGDYRWFLLRALPARDSKGRIVRWAGSLTDIDDLVRAEQAMAAARREAERATAVANEANHAKDQFLAVLSHELRTPLTPVAMAVGMLLQDPHADAAMRERLEMIRRNLDIEARLIDDLLDVTRITRGKITIERRPVELRTIIERAVEVCRSDIEARQLKLSVWMPERHCTVDADPERLQQAFWNLLRNAVKFSHAGGRLEVRSRTEGRQALVEVHDEGVGIDPELLPRLFQPFEQGGTATTRQYGGLGLGLIITKGLIELHGGVVWASSEGKGRGATFTVKLPVMPNGAAPAAPPAAPAAQPHARPSKLLLVEDHPDTARIMRQLLRGEGHDVAIASDVVSALALCDERTFDLILCDLTLPDGNGLDLIRELRARGCSAPAIALTGHGHEDDIRRSADAGFAAHLIKPVHADRLDQAIASFCGKAAPDEAQPEGPPSPEATDPARK